MRRAGALILAAGGSTRFGEPKQFLELEGETLLHRVARTAREAGCEPIVVVVREASQRAREELTDFPVRIVENPEWQHGIGSSIKCGIAELRATASAVVILACDQPFVSAETIRNLCAGEQPIIASEYAKTVGIPAFFDIRYFDALASLSDDAGAKSLIEANRADVGVVPFPDGAIDIDTRADYDALS